MKIIDKQALRKAAEGATQGEWHKGRQDPVTGIIKIYARTGITKLNNVARTDPREVGFGISEREHKANAVLISLASPINMLALLDELESAEKRIVELTEALRQMIQAYKSAFHTGYEIMVDLGVSCDSPEVMISGNPDIIHAEKVLAAGIGVA